MNITGVTVGGTSAIASPAKGRRYLGIFNQSTADEIFVAFDRPAVAAATAGQLTLFGFSSSGNTEGRASVVWSGEGVAPTNTIWLISAGTATPVTIIEG